MLAMYQGEHLGCGKPRVEQAHGESARDPTAELVLRPRGLQTQDLALEMSVEYANGHAELAFDAVADGIDALLRIRVFVYDEQLPAGNLKAVNQRIAGQMVVYQRRCRPNSPRAQGAEDELGLVGEAEGNERARRDAILEKVLGIAAGVGVRLSPGIASDARPDGLFCRGQPSHLCLEPVPETAAVVCARLAELALRCPGVAEAVHVFADVEFGVKVRGGGGRACNGAGDGHCVKSARVHGETMHWVSATVCLGGPAS
jgi:hypothetical protein